MPEEVGVLATGRRGTGMRERSPVVMAGRVVPEAVGSLVAGRQGTGIREGSPVVMAGTYLNGLGNRIRVLGSSVSSFLSLWPSSPYSMTDGV